MHFELYIDLSFGSYT